MDRQVDTVDDTWLVAEPTPLKNMSSSIGIPNVPNHQVYQVW